MPFEMLLLDVALVLWPKGRVRTDETLPRDEHGGWVRLLPRIYVPKGLCRTAGGKRA